MDVLRPSASLRAGSTALVSESNFVLGHYGPQRLKPKNNLI
jgi:hypothetical protein